MKREAQLLSALFAGFIITVAAVRDWIHDDADAEAAAAVEPPVAASPPAPPATAPAPGPVVDGAQLVEVHAGIDRWRAPGAASLEPGRKWIAVDVEVAVAAGSPFAFEDVAVLVGGRVESREPVVERIGAAGDRQRVRLAYAVPQHTTEVALGYGSLALTRAPIPLDDPPR